MESIAVSGVCELALGGGRGGHVHYAVQLAEESFDPAVERIRAHGLEV